jgi:geranylgeranyl pyrophosphate synthase
MINIEKLLKEMSPIIDKAVEKYIPKSYDRDWMIFTTGKPRYDYHIEAINKAIAEPIWEFLSREGKRWRPVLMLLLCEALNGDPEKFLDFVIIPEVIHNGTLMVDDIEDSSEFRRGKPCTYKIFGLDIAINAGNTMYYLPLLSLIKNKDKLSVETMNKIYEIYVQEMMNLGFGQATDIAWHKGLVNSGEVTEQQYLQMCVFKTGTLAKMSAKIGAVLAGANDETVEKIGKLAEIVGIAFQIQDDILNLTGEEFAERKGGFGEDITEGKRTLMVIHTLSKASSQDRKRLIEILNMHTTDQNVRNEAIAIIKKHGSIEYAKQFASKMVKESWSEVDKLLPESEAKERLKAFAYYLIDRKI